MTDSTGFEYTLVCHNDDTMECLIHFKEGLLCFENIVRVPKYFDTWEEWLSFVQNHPPNIERNTEGVLIFYTIKIGDSQKRVEYTLHRKEQSLDTRVVNVEEELQDLRNHVSHLQSEAEKNDALRMEMYREIQRLSKEVQRFSDREQRQRRIRWDNGANQRFTKFYTKWQHAVRASEKINIQDYKDIFEECSALYIYHYSTILSTMFSLKYECDDFEFVLENAPFDLDVYKHISNSGFNIENAFGHRFDHYKNQLPESYRDQVIDLLIKKLRDSYRM